MRTFIVSNGGPVATEVRNILLQEGVSLQPEQDVSLDLALGQLLEGITAELLVVVLSPDPERVLACLGTMRSLTQARVLVVGPTSDSRLVLHALRAGVSDYVDEAEVASDLPAALQRLREEMAPRGEQGRVIAVLALNGGSGSSTLTANIGTVLAKEHQSALLLDLNLSTGDLAALLDLKPAHTLADLCQNAARMDRVMFERSLAQHDSGVRLLAPPRAFADVSHVTPDGIRQALALGRSLFPYVVVDLDHSFREEQVEVLRLADIILLILRLDFSSLCNSRRALEHLDQLGISRERIRLVVNRFGQPKEIPAAKVEEVLRLKIFHYVPDDPKTINRANNNGIPAVLESPSARVSKSMARLTASINGYHKKQG